MPGYLASQRLRPRLSIVSTAVAPPADFEAVVAKKQADLASQGHGRLQVGEE